jgi:hypothetical protein
MKCAFGFLILFSVHAQLQALDESTPRAVPLFSNVEQGPAFMLECLNTSGSAIPATELIQEIALKVDEQPYERTGGIGGSFLGGMPVFESGERWRVMIGLRQKPTGTKSPDFGAALRSPWNLVLIAGTHTIAFRCLGNWSKEIEFYWESATVSH